MRIQLFGAGQLIGLDGSKIDLGPNREAILVDTTLEGEKRTETLQPDLLQGMDVNSVQVLIGRDDQHRPPLQVYFVVNRQTIAVLDKANAGGEQKLGSEAASILEYLTLDAVSPPILLFSTSISELKFTFEEVNALVDAVTKLKDGVERTEVCRQLGSNKILQEEVLNLIQREATDEDPGDFVRWALSVEHSSMQAFVEGLMKDQMISMIIGPLRRWT